VTLVVLFYIEVIYR